MKGFIMLLLDDAACPPILIDGFSKDCRLPND